MAAIHLRNQIVFRAPARVGLLADATDRLVGKGVNILALRAYDEGESSVLLIYPDDSRLAAEALEMLDGEVGNMAVIVAEVLNTPGQLAEIARVLSNANLSILQLHATTASECDRALVIIQTSNDVVAMDVLLQNL